MIFKKIKIGDLVKFDCNYGIGKIDKNYEFINNAIFSADINDIATILVPYADSAKTKHIILCEQGILGWIYAETPSDYIEDVGYSIL